MRILIDARLYGYENTGIGRYIIGLITNLVKIDKKSNDSKNEYSIILRQKYFDTLKFPKNWKKILGEFRHYSLKEQILLPLIVYKEKPDITHFLHFNVPILYWGKYIVTIHDLLMHTQRGLEATTLPWFEYFIKRFGYRIAFDTAVYKSKIIIAPADFVRQSIIDIYKINPSKIKRIYECADKLELKSDLSIVKKSDLINKKYLFYVGNSYPHKNLKMGIDAVIHYNLNNKTKIYYCIVSSRSFFTEKLNNYLKNKKGKEYIKIIGAVSDLDMGVLFKNSFGLLFPTVSEGFGIPGIEAMNYGTIILCSNIPILNEIYEDNAFYFDPKDVVSISKVISKAVSMSPTDRKNMLLKSSEFVKRYSWTKMAEETLKIYKSVV